MKRVICNILFFLSTFGMVHAQHLFLLAGQSNANGQGSSKKSSLYSTELALEYDVVADSVKPLKDPVGQQWNLLEQANTGTILPAFTQKFTALTKQPVTIVTAARGGSSCSRKAELGNFGTWDENAELYNQAIAKTDKAIQKTHQKLNGIIWMQGERDANAINDGKLTPEAYQTALLGLVKRFRKNYGRKLPFFIVLTGYQSGRPKEGNDAVRNAQIQVSKKLKHVFVVYEDTGTFFEKGWMKDHVHYSQEGLNAIGEAIAPKIFDIIF